MTVSRPVFAVCESSFLGMSHKTAFPVKKLKPTISIPVEFGTHVMFNIYLHGELEQEAEYDIVTQIGGHLALPEISTKMSVTVWLPDGPRDAVLYIWKAEESPYWAGLIVYASDRTATQYAERKMKERGWML